MNKYHVGLIVRSYDYRRVQQLLAQYLPRVSDDLGASAPAETSPSGRRGGGGAETRPRAFEREGGPDLTLWLACWP
jgi:hypothetical protein